MHEEKTLRFRTTSPTIPFGMTTRLPLALLAAATLTIRCGGDPGLQHFMSSVKQQHARTGHVDGAWILEQWAKVQGPTKSWIESMNAAHDDPAPAEPSASAREGPEPPMGLCGAEPPAGAPDDDSDGPGPRLDLGSGRTADADERGPLLVHEVGASVRAPVRARR